MSEKQRIAEMIREEKDLVAELRRLKRLGAIRDLDWQEEADQERLTQRLQEIRGEAREIAAEWRRRRRDRITAAREAREEEQRSLEEQRARTELENALITRIVNARRDRSFEVGLGGISAGGQPRGSTAVVELARKVEGEIAQQFDEAAQECFGYAARYVRNLGDDAHFGVHLDHKSGQIQAGPPGTPDSPVRSPVPTPHQDWGNQGPNVPIIES